MVTAPKTGANESGSLGARPCLLAAFAGFCGFFAFIQVYCLSLGTFGITLSRPLSVAGLIAAVACAGLFATRFFARRSAERSGPPVSAGLGKYSKTFWWLAGAAVIVWFLWVWYQLWMLASLRPPYDWDGLYYHLPAIQEWARAGRVSWIGNMPDVPYVNFPMGVELSSFFVFQLTGMSRLVNACNLWYWPLAFLSLAVIAGRLGARGAWPWVAGALIVGAPVFVSQSVSCYIDPGFAAAVMASIAASLVFVYDRGRSGWWTAVLLGAAVGLALGSKGTGLPFAAALVVVSAAALLRARGLERWRSGLARVGLVIVVAWAVGGYWYTRNAVVTGNPIHPIQLKIGEKVLIEGYDHVEFSRANLPEWLEKYPPALRVLVSWLQLDAPIHGFDPTGGMGYVWLAGCIPALVLMWVRYPKNKTAPPAEEFVFLSLLVLMLFVLQPAKWWARFTVWLHALGLPCLAFVAYHASVGWKRNRWHLLTIVLALGVIAVAAWESRITLRLEWDTGRTSQTRGSGARFLSSEEFVFGGLSETPDIDEFFGATRIARGRWGRYSTMLGGVLSLPLNERDIVLLPETLDEGTFSRLRSEGVEWIVWDTAGAGDVPEIIRRHAGDERVFNPEPELDLHFFRLRISQGGSAGSRSKRD